MQCLRDDAGADQTWQRSDDFYVFHDLLHYAVETSLHLESGFFGMLKSGISIHDFEGPRDQRPKLTRDAVLAETLAGVFQHEFAPGQAPFEDFNEVWSHGLALMGVTDQPPLSDAQIAALRTTIRNLLNRWKNTPVDGALELEF